MLIRKILKSLFIFKFFFLWAQDSGLKKIEIAKDSIIANPKYSYKLLLEVVTNKKTNDSIHTIAQLHLGSYFNDIGVVDSSMFYTKKALEKLVDQKNIAYAYRTLGSCYRRSSKMDDAVSILFKSLEISEKINSNDLTSKIKSDLGILYTEKRAFEKAFEFFKESIAVATTEQTIYGNYVNMGVSYFYKGDLNNSEKYFIKAFELVPIDKDPKVSATIALNIGDVQFENKKYNEAMSYFQKSKNIADTHGFQDKSLNAIERQAMTMDALGNHQQAIITLKNALIPAKEISSFLTQRNILKSLVEIHAKIKNYKKAHEYQKMYHKLKDSLTYKNQQKKIAELEVKYETEKKRERNTIFK